MLVETVLAGPGGFAAGAAFVYFAPELLRRRAVVFRRAVALVAAAGGAVSGAHATGLSVPDVAYSAALAAVVTLLAARATPRTVTVVAAAAGLAAIGTVGGLVGLAAFGFAAATTLTARRAPVATVVVGAAIANAVLRLRLPGPHGLESLLAATLVAIVCISGHRRLRRKTRRRARNGAALASAAIVVLSIVGVVAAAAARPGLERGTAHASQGLEAAKQAEQQQAKDELATAEEAFEDAARTLGAFWVRPAELVPVLSQHVRALTTAASSGRNLASAGGKVAEATDLSGMRIRDGQIPLAPVRALAPPLAAAERDVSKALVALRRVDSDWLVPPVSLRLDDNVGRLVDSRHSIETSRQLVDVLPALLGADGERRWFLAIQTPAEGRATGGFIRNFGEITATDGRLDLVRFGRTDELNRAGDPATKKLVGPADYLARYERFDVAHTWESVNLSPAWPAVTEVIAGLYPQSGGLPIDGALAIDPAGIAAFLQLTGPLTVPAWPEPLTATNAERILLYEQYIRFGDIADRVDFLGDAAEVLWSRLMTGELPPPEQIVKVLGPAVASKHIFISSLDDKEERALSRARLNGDVRPLRSDGLAVVTQNASGNKIDWFLERNVDYRVNINGAASSIEAKVKVTLRNGAPPGGLPAYIIGNSVEPHLPTGTSRLYVSIYSPLRLAGSRVDGKSATMESELELGRWVYSTFVDIPPQRSLELELDLVGRTDAVETYELDLHAQPLVTADHVRFELTWDDRYPVRRQFVLSGDRTLEFEPPTG